MGDVSDSLPASLLVVYTEEVILAQKRRVTTGEASEGLFGVDSSDHIAAVRAVEDRIDCYRREPASPGGADVMEKLLAVIGRKGVYGRSVWRMLYQDARRLGRAGFFLRALIQERIAHASPGSHVPAAELIRSIEALTANQFIRVLEHLLEPGSLLEETVENQLFFDLQRAGRLDLEELALWLGRDDVYVGPVQLRAHLAAWLTPGAPAPVFGQSEPVGEVEPLKRKVVSKSRKPAFFKWGLAALSLGIMCFSPLMMEDTRAMMSARGLPATYYYVVNKIAQNKLAARDLRDGAMILFRQGDIEEAMSILNDLAVNESYSNSFRAGCYLHMGHIRIERNPADGLTLFEVAHELYERPDQKNYSALEIARTHMLMKNYDEMEEWLDQGIAYREESGHGNIIREMHLRGRLAIGKGEYQSALDHALAGYQLFRDSDDLDVQALFAGELGVIYALNDDTENARKYTDRALYLLGRLGDRRYLDHILTNYILIDRVEGRPASEYHRQVIQTRIVEHNDWILQKEYQFVTGVSLEL